MWGKRSRCETSIPRAPENGCRRCRADGKSAKARLYKPRSWSCFTMTMRSVSRSRLPCGMPDCAATAARSVSPGAVRILQDKSLTETAIRETGEEIGICRERIRVLGEMPRLYIPTSHHDVYPTVGYCETLPRFRPNPQEVVEVFSFALDALLQPDSGARSAG